MTAHSLSVKDVLARLGVDPDRGLSHDEVQERLSEYGPNGNFRRTP